MTTCRASSAPATARRGRERWTPALVVGIALVVAGVGLVVTGNDQMEAAEEWDRQVHYCGTADSLTEQVECPDDPCAGGEFTVGFGAMLVVVGGVAARWGTQ